MFPRPSYPWSRLFSPDDKTLIFTVLSLRNIPAVTIVLVVLGKQQRVVIYTSTVYWNINLFPSDHYNNIMSVFQRFSDVA